MTNNNNFDLTLIVIICHAGLRWSCANGGVFSWGLDLAYFLLIERRINRDYVSSFKGIMGGSSGASSIKRGATPRNHLENRASIAVSIGIDWENIFNFES